MNLDTPENYPQDDKNFKNADTDPQNSDPNSNPYDSENLEQEPESDSKDITEKDIGKDLIENEPFQGFETDIDNAEDDKFESDLISNQ